MADEMDTLLATQRAKLAAEEREILIKRARGVPSTGAVVYLGIGVLILLIMMVAKLLTRSPSFDYAQSLGLIYVIGAYHRMASERTTAILALLDEEKHGPKEAWIRRLQQPAPRP